MACFACPLRRATDIPSGRPRPGSIMIEDRIRQAPVAKAGGHQIPIMADLVVDGVIDREKIGRQNQYRILDLARRRRRR